MMTLKPLPWSTYPHRGLKTSYYLTCYRTIWGPRHAGKTRVMQQVLLGLQEDEPGERFTVAKINLQHLKMQKDMNKIAHSVAEK